MGDEYHGYYQKKLAGWRDTGIRVQGPIARVMLKAFQESWKECGVGILDRGLGQEEKIFHHDLLDSVPLTEKDLSQWPLHERALGTFIPGFAPTFEAKASGCEFISGKRMA